MNPIPRQKLKEIIEKYGPSLCEDPNRCEGLLKDHCGSYRREIFVLVSALKDGAVSELLGTHSKVSPDLLFPKLIQRLTDNLGFSKDVAQWTIDTWVLALGVTSNNETPGHAAEALPDPSHEEILPSLQIPTEEKGNVPNLKTSSPSDLIVSMQGGQPYKTIGAAIRAASAGDRILVRQGVYREQVVLDKPLEILGDGPRKNILITSTKFPVIKNIASQAKIESVTIDGQPGFTQKLLFPKSIPDAAVEVKSGEFAMVDCDIKVRAEVGISIHGARTRALLKGCKISEARKGLLFADQSGGLVEECDVSANL